MVTNDRTFRKDFFNALADRPLEPGDPEYVALYRDPDPMKLLRDRITFRTGESVQLLSGFRGVGKSTELRRLRKKLIEDGYVVVLADMLDFLNDSMPVDVSDFLMAVATALGDGLKRERYLGKDPKLESYGERFVTWVRRTKVEIEGLEAAIEVGGAVEVGLKASLKSDPTFRRRLQERMAGHLASLVQDVRLYVEDCVKAVKSVHGDETEVVLLVDSMEKLRGTSVNAEQVHDSVETLFAVHADRLHLPYLHVIYTVPPYLKVRHPGLGGRYAPGGLETLPAVRLHRDDGNRTEDPAAYALMTEIVGKRGDWRRLFEDESDLERLVRMSGGHLRDLLRLVAEVVLQADSFPVSDRVIESAIDKVRNDYLPIADNDALWLDRVAETHRASLDDLKRLPDLARYLDTHLMLCYRNGHEWYDVHPLVRDHVAEVAEDARWRLEESRLRTEER